MKKAAIGDWYYDSGRHKEDLERDLAGLIHRHAELEAASASEAWQIKDSQAAVDAAKENLFKLYGVGQQKAHKRPAQAREKRAK